MASIRWTVGAQDDLRDVIDYIARNSLTFAAATADRILEASDRLRNHPRMGRVVPELEDKSVRELIVGSYRLMYHLHQRQVTIVAVVQSSRDLLRKIANEPWDLG